jgi:hypothetical protein
LDAAIDDVEAFKGNDYNALVVQPELLVSSKGKLVSDNHLLCQIGDKMI